jgi:hypothetical protein
VEFSQHTRRHTLKIALALGIVDAQALVSHLKLRNFLLQGRLLVEQGICRFLL